MSDAHYDEMLERDLDIAAGDRHPDGTPRAADYSEIAAQQARRIRRDREWQAYLAHHKARRERDEAAIPDYDRYCSGCGKPGPSLCWECRETFS